MADGHLLCNAEGSSLSALMVRIEHHLTCIVINPAHHRSSALVMGGASCRTFKLVNRGTIPDSGASTREAIAASPYTASNTHASAAQTMVLQKQHTSVQGIRGSHERLVPAACRVMSLQRCAARLRATIPRVTAVADQVLSSPVQEPRGNPQPLPLDSIYRSLDGSTWLRIRPYCTSHFHSLASLQTECFFTPPPLPAMQQLAYASMRAEVMDGLRKKEKTIDPECFQIFVAEDITDLVQCSQEAPDWWQPSLALDGIEGMSTPPVCIQQVDPEKKCPLVGTVEVATLDEQAVLSHLRPGTDLYAYISSMAVAVGSRRRGLAQVLLHIAEQQARQWETPDLALHVYDDNIPAVQLYQKAGFQQLNKDPGWRRLVGARVRLLMHRSLPVGQQQ